MAGKKKGLIDSKSRHEGYKKKFDNTKNNNDGNKGQGGNRQHNCCNCGQGNHGKVAQLLAQETCPHQHVLSLLIVSGKI